MFSNSSFIIYNASFPYIIQQKNMIFLQAASGLSGLIPLLLILPIFYFFMIRPQMKRQKEQQAYADGLEKGKEVVTSSGIIGKINKIEGNIVTLQIANNVFIRVTKGSVSKEMTEAFAATATNEPAV
jgi:preprotein translocase subunit YajC